MVPVEAVWLEDGDLLEGILFTVYNNTEIGRLGNSEQSAGSDAIMAFKGIRAQTQRMIDGEEDIDVEYKLSVGEVEKEDLVAFANAQGGTIIVGVRDIKQAGKREIVGCDVSDKSKRVVLNRASSCRPKVPIHISVENTGRKPILRVDIPEGTQKPYCTEGGTYKVRRQSMNSGVEPDLMAALILQREEALFVERFRHAADQLVDVIQVLESRLSKQIELAQSTVEGASRAAEAAELAAEEARDAAAAAFDAADSLHEY